ncbi:MAG: FtsX-like permease family protein [Planctomycetales bacterium]|nr:FtsX-like permease family protein [Planctomycetales bacterium]NIM08789.1 FtsX-like permease family protein [Planctomycetales bacterium]NIN08253.1 FtsX-like permease family protein [Planctomycetales bacterium]NIN77378.1 FtsX-like permease family protein [Planctomycetales bacterium]NIO34561.1 FtsX-like permease family protein [Planctomycetales bacterium]
MRSLDRKLLRELRRSPGLLLAIASIITIGVMMFVYMRSTFYNLNTAKSHYYAQGRMADFWIDVKKAPLTELNALADLQGVVEIRSRIQFFATVDLPQVAKPLNGLVLSLPDRRRSLINDIHLVRGSYFTDRRDNEVIVNDAFARRRGIQPGDWIHLILNNRRQELFVAGTAISCEFVYSLAPGAFVPDPEHFGVFYLKRRYAEEVFDFDGAANQVVGRLAPPLRDRPAEFFRRAEQVLHPFGVISKIGRRDQASHRFLSDEIRGLGVFAAYMPAIFLAVAALVLNVLISRLTEQQRTVIGTLKAIGYSNRAIFFHYLKFGMAVGLLGGLAGVIAGYFMARWVTDLYTHYFEFPELTNRFQPLVYLLAMSISLLFALAGSIFGARKAVRLQPAEAMRPKPPQAGHAVWLERVPFLWEPLSFSWRMVVRLIIRHRLRTSVGMFAAAMGAGLLTCGFMLSAAMVFLVDFQYSQIIRSDFDLSLAEEKNEAALDEALRLPGVDYAEPVLYVAGTFRHGPYQRKGAVTAIRQAARLTVPHDKQRQAIQVPDVGFVMSRKLAEILHVNVGDIITFQPTRGLQRPRQVPVARIAEGYLGMSVYAEMAFVSRLIDEELAINSLQLKTNPAPLAKAALYRELKHLPTLQAVNERADVIRNLDINYIEVQNIFIGLLTLFAGVIFFGSILTASIIGLAERQREVATLQVLGHTPWQIGGLFLRESGLVNLTGAIIGLPLGYLLTQLLAWYYDTELFRFPVIWSNEIVAKTLLLAMSFTLLAHLVVQRNVHRTNWVEALNVKE